MKHMFSAHACYMNVCMLYAVRHTIPTTVSQHSGAETKLKHDTNLATYIQQPLDCKLSLIHI